MWGYVIEHHGGPEVLSWRELPSPVPGPGEVLVRVAAVGVNHLDLWVRRGVPGHRFPLPLVPGSDIVGTIEEAVPQYPELMPGTRYFVSPGYSCNRCLQCLTGQQQLCRSYGIFGESCNGGYARYVAVPAVNLVPIPEHLTFVEAASMPLTFLTAWHMLVSRAHVRPGQWVLVQAASSGVSSAAIQVARLWGANVIATGSTPEKLEYALKLGAGHALESSREDFVKEVRRITGGAGIDIVVDHVGAPTFKAGLAVLAKGGSLVLCGATAGHLVETDLRMVFFKGISILGSTMGSPGEMLEIARHIAGRRLTPNLQRVLPISEAAEAHRLVEGRMVLGKVVLAFPEE
jgi:NADPH:quinone reductase-like Zn-dependent oxidoreductase